MIRMPNFGKKMQIDGKISACSPITERLAHPSLDWAKSVDDSCRALTQITLYKQLKIPIHR